MVDDVKSVDESVRLVLNSIIGGKVVHVCLFNDIIVNNGLTVVVEKGNKQYALNVHLPENIHLDDCLETQTWEKE